MRNELILAYGLKIKRDISGLNIERRWLNSKHLLLLVFVTILYGLFLFIDIAKYVPEIYASPLSVQALLDIFSRYLARRPLFNHNAALPSILLVVILTYLTLSHCINRTNIIVNMQKLIIKHGPIPALGNKTVETSDIRQLYSKEHISYSRYGFPIHSYEIHAETKSGRDIKLISGIDDKSQALYIEHEIEKFLRIKDEYVSD